MKFGIIGCGMVAHYHAVAINTLENTVLAGVCGGRSEKLRAFCEKYGTTPYSSYEELLADPSVDAIAICTPSGDHAANAMAALRAGKHVVVEKPVCITKEDADMLLEAAKYSGRTVSVISQNRFSDGAAELKRAIEDGELGRLISANLTMNYFRDQSYYDSGSWRGTRKTDGGGVLMNQGIHGVDMLAYLMGHADSVCAYCATLLRNIEVEDTLCAAVHFENGAMGTVNATVCSENPTPMRLEICGEKGNVTLQGKNIVYWGLNTPCGVEVTEASEPVDKSAPASISYENHIRQYRDVVSAITQGRSPAVTVEDGRHALDIILGIYESAATDRKINIEY